MHLPRSVFSQRQVDLLTWILHINGVQNVPSVRTLKTLEDGLQKICGIETLPFTGALGHKYYMNSLADIIRQASYDPLPLWSINSANQINIGDGKSSCSISATFPSREHRKTAK